MLQGQGDVYGLVDYLYRLQYGQRLLVIDDISINARSAWLQKDQTLLWSVRAHGLYPAPEGFLMSPRPFYVAAVILALSGLALRLAPRGVRGPAEFRLDHA